MGSLLSTIGGALAAEAGQREVTVYVDGVFDLFHAGHVKFLWKARSIGISEKKSDNVRLLVGVITDRDAGWKREPFVEYKDRLAVVANCAPVDAVVEDPPLVLTDAFLDENRIDLVIHGDDSRQEEFFGAAIRRGIMRYVPYTPGISTSAIARRVQAAATSSR